MIKKEDYLQYLLKNMINIHSKEVVDRLKALGIELGEHPYKLYGVTYEGNGHEVCVFLNAFSTYEECQLEFISEKDFHGRHIDLEEDF